MGQSCLDHSIMQFFVLLSVVVAAAVAAPAPQGSPAAEAYVHEEIAAEPYVHEEIDAEAYAHEEIAAESYVHEEIAAEAYAHIEPVVAYAAPVAYAGYPYAVGHLGYGYAAPVAYAAYATGCVNTLGSVVPCAQY